MTSDLLSNPKLELFPGPATVDHPAELWEQLESAQYSGVPSHLRVAVDREGVHTEDGRVGVQQPGCLLEEPGRGERGMNFDSDNDN